MPGPLSRFYCRSIPLHFPNLIVRVATKQGKRADRGQRWVLTWIALVKFLHIGTVVACVGFVSDLLFRPAIPEARHRFFTFALLGRAHAALRQRHLFAAGQAHRKTPNIADQRIQGIFNFETAKKPRGTSRGQPDERRARCRRDDRVRKRRVPQGAGAAAPPVQQVQGRGLLLQRVSGAPAPTRSSRHALPRRRALTRPLPSRPSLSLRRRQTAAWKAGHKRECGAPGLGAGAAEIQRAVGAGVARAGLTAEQRSLKARLFELQDAGGHAEDGRGAGAPDDNTARAGTVASLLN